MSPPRSLDDGGATPDILPGATHLPNPLLRAWLVAGAVVAGAPLLLVLFRPLGPRFLAPLGSGPGCACGRESTSPAGLWEGTTLERAACGRRAEGGARREERGLLDDGRHAVERRLAGG